jgi:hypothetical protein
MINSPMDPSQATKQGSGVWARLFPCYKLEDAALTYRLVGKIAHFYRHSLALDFIFKTTWYQAMNHHFNFNHGAL